MKKTINSLYEIKSPAGYVGMGYRREDIPLIFESICNSEEQIYESVIRFSDVHFDFKQIKNTMDDIHALNEMFDRNRVQINQKIYTEIDENNLKNDLNIFLITASHDWAMPEYVEDMNFENIFFPKTLDFIKSNKDVKVIFLDLKEGAYVYSDSFFDKFYNVYKTHNLSKTQLVFITNTSNIEEFYISYLKRKNLENFMKVGVIHWYVYNSPGKTIIDYLNCITEKNQTIKENNKTYSISTLDDLELKRKKHYLSLNRNSERFHRPKLVLNLIKNDLFEKGDVSLLQSDRFDEFCESKKNKEYKELIKNKYPFVVDYSEPDVVANMHNYFTHKDVWNNSYFSIVSETSIKKDFVFITEKCIRPMIYYHPFILWSNPFTLRELKKLGFETFPEFFDESYDSVIDENERLKLIINNVKILCDKSLDEIHNLYQSVKPKLIHNRNLLIDFYKNDKVIETFIEVVG